MISRIDRVSVRCTIATKPPVAAPPPANRRHGGIRDVGVDVCRGLAILAVVGIHITGHFATRLGPAWSGWAADIIANRLLEFAVPTFLMLSALVIGRKLYALPMRQRMSASWQRIPRLLAIYLVVSILYFAVSSRHNASVLVAHNLAHALLWGKASFHLYFLIVLIQMIALLPFATLFVRAEWSLPRLIAGAALLQASLYALNRLHPAPYPGTLISWYAMPMMLGIWLASRGAEISVSRSTSARLFWMVAIAAVAYLPFATADMAGERVDSLLFQATNWAYTSAAALLVLAYAQRVSKKLAVPLALLGRYSLIIYLLHPLAIEFLDHLTRAGALRCPTLLSMVAYIAACIALPILIACCWQVAAVIAASKTPESHTQRVHSSATGQSAARTL